MTSSQEVDFPIKLNLGPFLRTFFYSQLFVTPPNPIYSFAGKTIIVTGANSGLGLEASRQFYRLGAAKLILTVRTVSKGQAAKEDILRSVSSRNDADAIDVWLLDMGSTESTLSFANRAKTELPRIDAVILNAGISTPKFVLLEGYESSVQINVLNTFLLALSLLPKLQATKAAVPETTPHLTIVSSEAHHLTKFPEINSRDLFNHLNDQGAHAQQPRYQATKLMEVLLMRELVARLKNTGGNKSDAVIINAVNPGLCMTTFGSKDGDQRPLMFRILLPLVARRADVGARCYVHAAAAPSSSHGEMMSDGVNQDVEGWIYGEVGRRVQAKVWEQTAVILEGRRPGLLTEVGL